VTLDRGVLVGQAFHSLVRPRRRVSAGASEVHGLRDEDLRAAPPMEVVLPRFLAYWGQGILVGHNSNRFDNAFLERALAEHLGRGLNAPLLDTLEIAGRLLPHQSRGLASLLTHLGIPEAATHRAEQDARATASLLLALLAENRWQRELESLSEYLPLAALGTAAAGLPQRDEHELLRQAALRSLPQAQAEGVLNRLSEALPTHLGFEASRLLAAWERERPAASAGDFGWLALQEEWRSRAALFAQISDDRSLQAFVDYVATATSADDLPSHPDAVTLMTLHNAKGKEFRAVILVGVEEGEIPYWTAKDAARLEEERRVLYVGMTRARERLYLTSVEQVGNRRRNPSSFLHGLPQQLLKRVYHYGPNEG
ncbi:MAG: ATP-binding domain-containing protein, partial [Chloroflexi bacterium]|nr:ATP-binding domain-containing protein [Chloroflexota bacterium]